MKIVSLVLFLIAVGLIAYNVTLLDFSDIFAKDSFIALISIAAAICAILLLLILRTSKKIDKKLKGKK